MNVRGHISLPRSMTYSLPKKCTVVTIRVCHPAFPTSQKGIVPGHRSPRQVSLLSKNTSPGHGGHFWGQETSFLWPAGGIWGSLRKNGSSLWLAWDWSNHLERFEKEGHGGECSPCYFYFHSDILSFTLSIIPSGHVILAGHCFVSFHIVWWITDLNAFHVWVMDTCVAQSLVVETCLLLVILVLRGCSDRWQPLLELRLHGPKLICRLKSWKP